MNRFMLFVLVCLLLFASLVVPAQTPQAAGKESRPCAEPSAKPTGQSISKSKFVPLRTAVGDLTEDGIDETAVLVRETGSKGPARDEVFVYDKEARLLFKFAVGEAGEYVLSIKGLGSRFVIDNGSLILDLAVRERAGDNLPSHFRTVEFRWNGSKMIEVARSEARPLPQHMREKG